MASAELQGLLDAVRRRLWRARLQAAARHAAWASAVGALALLACHLALHPVPLFVLALLLAAPWAAGAAWAGTQRPTDAACALWADRRLGGATAFSTWLEQQAGAAAPANAAARRWLERWATARVPESLDLLAAWREPARWARPAVAALVCSGLAAGVLNLPGRGGPPAANTAAAPTSRAATDTGLATAPGETAVAPELVHQIASALHPADTQPDTAPAGGGAGTAAATPGAPDERLPTGASTPAQRPTDPAPAGRAAPNTPATEAPAAPGTAQMAGAGGGREAGESRDTRADVGVSRAPAGPMTVTRSAPGSGRNAGERRADLDQAARYDDTARTPGDAAAARAWADPPAATPPPATDGPRLSPTEAHYVQTWMQASPRRR